MHVHWHYSAVRKAFCLKVARQTKGTNINIILHCLYMLATAALVKTSLIYENLCTFLKVEWMCNWQKYISIFKLQVACLLANRLSKHLSHQLAVVAQSTDVIIRTCISLCAVQHTMHAHSFCQSFPWYELYFLGGALPIMAYTGRLHPKGVPFSGFRYIKG